MILKRCRWEFSWQVWEQRSTLGIHQCIRRRRKGSHVSDVCGGAGFPGHSDSLVLRWALWRFGWIEFGNRFERSGVSWPLGWIAFPSSTFTEPPITGAAIRTGNTWSRKNLAGIDLDYNTKIYTYEISIYTHEVCTDTHHMYMLKYQNTNS